MNKIVYTLILIFSIPIHSQDLNTSISIVADRVVPFLFNSDNNENLLLIRKQAGEKFLNRVKRSRKYWLITLSQ